MKWNRNIKKQRTNIENLKRHALDKDNMSKIKGGLHYEYINGEWILVPD
ncbi:MAG: hypothetical protein LBJ72_07785 [Dysgonamonadaceae bacterium]|jgi:hypothetical protein|nr:hypothetical protein [Dysgonamonadaceae bacterium]